MVGRAVYPIKRGYLRAVLHLLRKSSGGNVEHTLKPISEQVIVIDGASSGIGLEQLVWLPIAEPNWSLRREVTHHE